MLFNKRKIFTSLAILAIPTLSIAEGKIPETEYVKQNVIKNVPYIRIEEVSKTPVDNLYFVETNEGLYISDRSGSYILNGELIDIKNDKNISSEKKEEVATKSLAKINKSDYIRYEAKDKKHTLYMFSDTSCPYCKKFHKEIPKLVKNGVEVVILPFPRGGKDNPSFKDLTRIMCSNDKSKALEEFDNGITKNLPNFYSCFDQAKKVEDTYALGGKLGVKGTPTSFFENGVEIGGYTTADRIIKGLNFFK